MVMVIDFDIINFKSIDDRILFLKYVLEKELDVIFENGDITISTNKLMSDFYKETINLLNLYIKFVNKRDMNKSVGLVTYSNCSLFTKLYIMNYKTYLNKYFDDEELSISFIESYYNNKTIEKSSLKEEEIIFLSNNLSNNLTSNDWNEFN